jgi:hypothetical protein
MYKTNALRLKLMELSQNICKKSKLPTFSETADARESARLLPLQVPHGQRRQQVLRLTEVNLVVPAYDLIFLTSQDSQGKTLEARASFFSETE